MHTYIFVQASLGSNLAAGLAQLPKPGTQISAQDQEKVGHNIATNNLKKFATIDAVCIE